MAEQKTPTSRVVRFATRGRRQSTLIGRDPSGRRIPGGPYTMWQGLTVVVAPFLLWHSRGLWLIWHADGLSQIIAVAGLTVGAAWLAGRLQFSHSPFWSAVGLLSNCGQVIRGGPAAAANRTAGRTGTRYSGAAYIVASTLPDPGAFAGRQTEPVASAAGTVVPPTVPPPTVPTPNVLPPVGPAAADPVTGRAPTAVAVAAGSPGPPRSTTAGRFCPTAAAGGGVPAGSAMPDRPHRPMSGLEAFLASSTDPVLDLESSVSR